MKIKFPTYEIELSVVELKELFDFKKTSVKTEGIPKKDSSSKPTIELKELSTSCKNSTHKLPVDSSSKLKTDISQNSKKISNETIKNIKDLALEGKSNKEIAKRVNVSPQVVNYWRKNTPKDYDGNDGLV